MVLLLLGSLAMTCWSGLEAYGDEGHGPLASVDGSLISSALADRDGDKHRKGGSEFCEEVHELFANFTLFLVFLHIAGVVVSSILHGENLVGAMLSGYKKNT
jgi:cytochrome b